MSILTKDNIRSIMRVIEQEIKPVKMSQGIVDDLLEFIRKYRQNTDISLEDNNAKIVKLFVINMKNNLTNKQIDIKEILKNEIKKQVGDNSEAANNKLLDVEIKSNNIIQKPAPVNTSVAIEPTAYHELLRVYGRDNIIRSSHLLFDSFNKDRTDNRTDRYVFHFENSYSKREGTVNALGQIRDIIEMEIFPFELPFSSSVNNYYNKITMLVGEFKQGFVGPEEFHFIFNTQVLSNNTVRLTPVNPVYKLRDPITKIDNLTLIFKAPFSPVNFHPDTIQVTVNYTNPPEFTTSSSHFLESGDLVYFTNFTTANLSADNSVIAETNRIDGHTITKLTDTMFSIPILDYTLVTPLNNFTPTVRLGSKRAIIPMRVGYLLPQKDVSDF